jgi:hypothetical protein
MLLTVLLLPCLLKAASSGASPNPRVVIVSSDVHYWAKLSKEEVESDKILQKLSDQNYCTPQWVHSFSRLAVAVTFVGRGMSGRYGLTKRP